MGTPLPLNGSNPYTGMYQNRQFGVGSPYSPTSQHQVSGYLADPPTALVDAEAQTPLVEQAEFWGLYDQTVTVTGAPTSGTFVLQYGVNFTGQLAYNIAAADLQTALRALSSLSTGTVNVTGSAGGPWTIALVGNFANTPVQLFKVRSTNFGGGTLPNVVVTSTSIQQGISPF